jgi:hypothetical protein
MGIGLLGDTSLVECLRRVNLDAFWSREPSTIKQNLGKVSWALQIAHELGILYAYAKDGTLEVDG